MAPDSNGALLNIHCYYKLFLLSLWLNNLSFIQSLLKRKYNIFSNQLIKRLISWLLWEGNDHVPYILPVKSILGRERASYFLPAEGKMFWAILNTQHYRIQPNKSQSWNTIITSLPTNPLLINKQLLFHQTVI